MCGRWPNGSPCPASAAQLERGTKFAAVQAKIVLRRKPKGAAKAVNGIRPFTGHLFCQSCGSVYYAKTSKNRKGEYHFYGCGSRQRNGVAACPHSVSVREDKLLEAVVNTYNDLLDDADSLITGAVAEGRRQLDAGRGESARIRQMVSKTEEEVTSLIRLLSDPQIETNAKKAISGRLGAVQEEAEKQRGRLAQIEVNGKGAEDRLKKVAGIAYREMRENFTKVTTFRHMNRFVENFVGPMEVTTEGVVRPRTTQASAGAEACVNSNIAGG